MTTTSIMDLLDANLDDLKDMPESKPFPNGTHRVTISWDSREINGTMTLIQKLTAVETLELADAGDTPLNVGDSVDILYGANEFAQASLKQVLKPLADVTGITNVGELLEATNGFEVVVTTKQRAGKKPADGGEARVFTVITSVQVA